MADVEPSQNPERSVRRRGLWGRPKRVDGPGRVMPERSTFVPDEPVADLSSKDLFGHHAYTEALAKAVLAARAPFTIGVFGSWGVGKTTIAKDYLASALARDGDSHVAYAYFDAWKYEGDSLRRQFLRDIAGQLKATGALKKSYEPDTELEDLRSDVRETVEDNIGISWRRLLTALVRAAAIFAVVFALLQIPSGFDDKTQEQLVIALLAALVAAMSAELRQTIVVGGRELVRKSLDSPELFETKFGELMDAITREKVVVVIDNLDRCSPDRVVEILSTIKTFLEPSGASHQPVFVIPCDEEAILKHLKERSGLDEADAKEFLRKFFSATLRVNLFLEEEIRDYVNGEVAGLQLGEDLSMDATRELVQIVTVAFRANPRRVKQFLNTVSAKLLLIREREHDGAIVPPISGEVSFVAKLTVIEEEFPDFYRAIQHDFRAFDRVSQAAIGIGDVPEKLRPFSDDEHLSAFLRGTRRTTSENVRPFTRLRLSAVERELPEYYAMRSALVDGGIEDLTSLLEGTSDEVANRYAEAANGVLGEELQNSYFDAALNVVDAFVRVAPLKTSSSAKEVVERLFAVPELQALLPTLPPDETVRLLGSVATDASRALVNAYVLLLKQDEVASVPADLLPQWKTKVAEGLASIRELLSNAQRVLVRQAAASEPLTNNQELLAALGESQQSAADFLGPEAFAATTAHLNRESLLLDDTGELQPTQTTRLLENSSSVAEARGIGALVERATQLLAEIPGDPTATGLEGLLELLLRFRVELEATPEPLGDRFVEQLIATQGSVPSHRKYILAVLCARLYSNLSDDLRGQASSLVGQLTLAEPVRELQPFVQDELQRETEPRPSPLLDVTLTGLGERFRTSSEPDVFNGVSGLFIDSLAALGTDRVADLFFQAVDARNIQALSTSFATHGPRLETDGAEIIDAVIERLIEAMPSFPSEEQPAAFDLLGSLHTHLKKAQRTKLREQIIELACADDPASRTVGCELVRIGRLPDLLSDADRRHILEHIILWLVSRTASIDASYAPSLGLIIDGHAQLSDDAVNNIIGLLTNLIDNPGAAPLAAEYLAQLPLGTQRDTILLKLIDAAKRAPDSSQRHALARRANEIARQDRRTRGAKAVKTYAQELSNSPEDASVASELLAK